MIFTLALHLLVRRAIPFVGVMLSLHFYGIYSLYFYSFLMICFKDLSHVMGLG